MVSQREKLKSSLSKAGLPQARFAEMVGISAKHMSVILGGGGLSPFVAARIAQTAQELGCEIDPFLLLIERINETAA